MIDISTKGKGAIPDKLDLRDYRFDMVFGASSLPNEYDLSDKVGWDKDQGSSGSCGGQSFSYYMEILSYLRDGTYTKLSARDLYAYVHLQPEGSRASDLLKRLSNAGIAEEADITSYENGNPPSEQFMQSETGETPEISQKAMQYWTDQTYLSFNSKDPEQVKQAIWQGKGAVLALWGNNACWTTSNGEIAVPAQGTTNWGHFVFLVGWVYRNGKLFFKFKNSWGKDWGDNGFGYLPVEYLTQGFGQSEWIVTLLPKGQYTNMMKMITILKNLIQLIKEKLSL